MGEDYTILRVETRNSWQSSYGPMQDYALVVQKTTSSAPEEGWVQLSQKPETPAPVVNGTLHGYVELKQNTKTGAQYKKFKKVNPDQSGARSGSTPAPAGGSINPAKVDYIVQMLEELTGRRDGGQTEPEEPFELPDPFKDHV